MRRPRLLRRALLLLAAILAVLGGVIALGSIRQTHRAALAASPRPIASALPAGAPSPPQPIILSGSWQFLVDSRNRGLAAGLWRGNVGSAWRRVRVPHVFDSRLLPRLFGGTVGWYRLRFRTPTTRPGFGWAIHFDQARRSAAVWLNGHFLGGWKDPYTPFQLTLPALRKRATNELVVRVDNRKAFLPREGWWNWGGLTRPVSLVPLGPVTTSDIGLLPQVKCPTPDSCSAALLVDATLANRSQAPVAPRLALTLAPPGGGAAQTTTLAVPPLRPGASLHVRTTVPVSGPLQLWAPGHPALYSAKLATLDGQQIAQRDSMQIGMRQVSVRNGVLYLNGRPINIRGASIEEDMPGHGPALTQADDATIVRELRALHANVTRSQYPLSSLMLDQLDRAGILLWTEAPIYHADELLHTSAQRNAALATLRGSVLQTRNHPSVFAESIANELSPTPDVVPATRSYIDAAVRLVRQLDPGTPVALDVLSYPNYPPQQTFLQFDLLGIDNYFGWYTGRPGIHSTANINWLAPYLRTTHARYPHQALVMTEFGAEADVPGPITEKQTYAFQTRYLEDTLGIVDSLPFMNGALYWTVREFAVKPFWDGGAHRNDVPRTAIHHKGLISYTGVPKPAFGVAARLFAHTPLYRSPPPLAPAGSPDNGPSIPGGFAPLVSVLAALLLLGAVLALRPRWRAARREETEPVPSPDSVSP